MTRMDCSICVSWSLIEFRGVDVIKIIKMLLVLELLSVFDVVVEIGYEKKSQKSVKLTVLYKQKRPERCWQRSDRQKTQL